MLAIFRRHSRTCKGRARGRAYRGCRCPLHVEGTLEGAKIRCTLKTRLWNRAQEKVRAWESTGFVSKSEITVTDACAGFLTDGAARNLRASTLVKYDRLCRQFSVYCESKQITALAAVTIEHLDDFRSQWPNRNYAALKKLEALRTMFKFFHERDWIPSNPARALKKPVVRSRPTLPFTRDECAAILQAVDAWHGNRARLRAFVLALRYTGMRIGDVCALRRDAIKDGKLMLYTAKTGVPIYLPLPSALLDSLADCHPGAHCHPERSEGSPYFFWSGTSQLKAPITVWEDALQRLFKKAGVAGGHAHRFRDTFAVELLLAGVPLDRVSIMLGHQSVKVTERHYSPWVKARQTQIEDDIRRSWGASQDAPPRSPVTATQTRRKRQDAR